MKIPKVIIKNNRKYFFVKEYKNFIRYIDAGVGYMTCFSKYELGLIPETIKEHQKEALIGRRKLDFF